MVRHFLRMEPSSEGVRSIRTVGAPSIRPGEALASTGLLLSSILKAVFRGASLRRRLLLQQPGLSHLYLRPASGMRGLHLLMFRMR